MFNILKEVKTCLNTNLIKKGCFKLKKLTVGQVEPESVKKARLRLRKFFFVTVNSLT